MSKIAIVIFDDFTDLDLFLMWDLLNRVKVEGWSVRILGTKATHLSKTGMSIETHGPISDANDADAVMFVSGSGTRKCIVDNEWISQFDLDPRRQLIGSICSGALILAKLGLLDGLTATTYPTVKASLESFGVEVVERPFVAHGNIATAGGCLAQQYLISWVVENLADKTWSDIILKSIQPVGEGLFFEDAEQLTKLYAPQISAKTA